jgi:alginate O-acetyltransferase complex protein AlgI
MIVYLVSGIWHGANYTFILWGILHGLFCVLYRWKKSWFDSLHPVMNWLLTFGFVNLAWILFRADSIGDALVLLKAMLRMEIGPVNENILRAFLLPELNLLISKVPQLLYFQWYPNSLLLVFYAGAMALILGARNAREHMLAFRPTVINLLAAAFLLFWCVMSFSGVSTFLYFNF